MKVFKTKAVEVSSTTKQQARIASAISKPITILSTLPRNKIDSSNLDVELTFSDFDAVETDNFDRSSVFQNADHAKSVGSDSTPLPKASDDSNSKENYAVTPSIALQEGRVPCGHRCSRKDNSVNSPSSSSKYPIIVEDDSESDEMPLIKKRKLPVMIPLAKAVDQFSDDDDLFLSSSDILLKQPKSSCTELDENNLNNHVFDDWDCSALQKSPLFSDTETSLKNKWVDVQSKDRLLETPEILLPKPNQPIIETRSVKNHRILSFQLDDLNALHSKTSSGGIKPWVKLQERNLQERESHAPQAPTGALKFIKHAYVSSSSTQQEERKTLENLNFLDEKSIKSSLSVSENKDSMSRQSFAKKNGLITHSPVAKTPVAYKTNISNITDGETTNLKPKSSFTDILEFINNSTIKENIPPKFSNIPKSELRNDIFGHFASFLPTIAEETQKNECFDLIGVCSSDEKMTSTKAEYGGTDAKAEKESKYDTMSIFRDLF
ncbi:hypothetical protein HK100_001180 [Physocladia obscura]|uniref:Uncharacterized protein n=1 Tax=Physocladia obscura TaxID=109957 RepID=A0AAD5SZR4_9FUNG|nr:hypothetical protein HK100_001180 [Physocladia obscura]